LLDNLLKTATRKLKSRGKDFEIIKKVLLINPLQLPAEFFDSEMARMKRYFCYPPYGIGILATLLKKNNFTVEILDLNYELLKLNLSNNSEIEAEERRLIGEKLKEMRSVDLIGISCMFTLTHQSFKRACRVLRGLEFDGLIAAGGVHVTNDQIRILTDVPEIDLVFPYESEALFLDFVCAANSKKQVEQSNPLDISPDYLNLPIGRYSDFGEIGAYRFWWRPNTKAGTILSNRGCRAHCTFCSVEGFNGPGVRSRSVKSVVDEMERQKDSFGVSHFMWLDDDLFYDHARTVNLFNEIVRRHLDVTWDASNGIIASAASDEIISAASESGCVGLHVGIESGNKEILKSIRKPSGIRHFIDLGARLKKYPKIFSKGFLIIGFPNETIGQINDTIKLAHEMSLDWYTVSLLSPLPSTKIYDQMVELGLINSEKIESKEINYGSMQTGLQKRRESNLKDDAGHINSLTTLDASLIPSRELLQEIWFDVDYHINYSGIDDENNSDRLKKLKLFLEDVSFRMTAGKNPLVKYYLAVINAKLGFQHESNELLNSAQLLLTESSLWRGRFKNLNLEISDHA
jgi:radical SAM superfamily enzyme YgiQ (UPF0313 family)